jgi:hypothetical protein
MLEIKPHYLRCPYSHHLEDCPIVDPEDLAIVINYLHNITCALGSVCDIDDHQRICQGSAAEILHCTNGDPDKARDAIWATTRAYEAGGGNAVVLWPWLRTMGGF